MLRFEKVMTKNCPQNSDLYFKSAPPPFFFFYLEASQFKTAEYSQRYLQYAKLYQHLKSKLFSNDLIANDTFVYITKTWVVNVLKKNVWSSILKYFLESVYIFYGVWRQWLDTSSSNDKLLFSITKNTSVNISMILCDFNIENHMNIFTKLQYIISFFLTYCMSIYSTVI
jgi:hypothetical protein